MRRASGNVVPLSNFKPETIVARSEKDLLWVDRHGKEASPPDYSALPDPSAVLRGEVLPKLDLIRFRSDKTFVAGGLQRGFSEWEREFGVMRCFGEVRKWLCEGVDFYDFFQQFSGVFKGRHFDSVVPPHMYFQNAPNCIEHIDFIETAIKSGLQSGAIRYVGRMGYDPPPRVINPLSVNVEPTKKRLVLSMKGVNLFCKDSPLSLNPLTEIVKGIEPRGFFSSLDDVNGYKQMQLKEKSWEFCGFQWGGNYFVDVCLPFGWKNSAYVYTSTGEVLSEWLRKRGVHTSLWIDDRFVGSLK